MKARSEARPSSSFVRVFRAAFLLAAFLGALSLPGLARGEIFKWVDDNDVAHYTSNRASIPIKYQDTVKLVDTGAGVFRARDLALPEGPAPEVEEERIPPETATRSRKAGTDVVGDVLEGSPQGTRRAAAPPETAQRPVVSRTARLSLRAYTGKGEGWWRAQFAQAEAKVEKQQRIVDAYRNQLRSIIKSHASGNEVLPLEDDPDFQKMARVLPREESRLNQHKRDLRRLEARAQELRIPDSWRD